MRMLYSAVLTLFVFQAAMSFAQISPLKSDDPDSSLKTMNTAFFEQIAALREQVKELESIRPQIKEWLENHVKQFPKRDLERALELAEGKDFEVHFPIFAVHPSLKKEAIRCMRKELIERLKSPEREPTTVKSGYSWAWISVPILGGAAVLWKFFWPSGDKKNPGNNERKPKNGLFEIRPSDTKFPGLSQKTFYADFGGSQGVELRFGWGEQARDDVEAVRAAYLELQTLLEDYVLDDLLIEEVIDVAKWLLKRFEPGRERSYPEIASFITEHAGQLSRIRHVVDRALHLVRAMNNPMISENKRKEYRQILRKAMSAIE